MELTHQLPPQSNLWTAFKRTVKRSDLLTSIVRSSIHTGKRILHSGKWNRVTSTYLSSHTVKKLEIGARIGCLEGWLSTDLDPLSESTVYLDATKRFPFETGTFDYIYCEHMIEHISWANGQRMLRECHRVLKPGGVIRIATPDLAVVLGLYNNPNSPLQTRYIQWMMDKELPDNKTYNASFVINNAFRNWGHQFLYDGMLMDLTLSQCGFASVRRCTYGQSRHQDLDKIESHGKHIGDDEIAIFESMVFEATRPIALLEE